MSLFVAAGCDCDCDGYNDKNNNNNTRAVMVCSPYGYNDTVIMESASMLEYYGRCTLRHSSASATHADHSGFGTRDPVLLSLSLSSSISSHSLII